RRSAVQQGLKAPVVLLLVVRFTAKLVLEHRQVIGDGGGYFGGGPVFGQVVIELQEDHSAERWVNRVTKSQRPHVSADVAHRHLMCCVLTAEIAVLHTLSTLLLVGKI